MLLSAGPCSPPWQGKAPALGLGTDQAELRCEEHQQLCCLCTVISSTNHSVCGSPWPVHREETNAFMIRNEAVPPDLARRGLSPCNGYQAPRTSNSLPPWLLFPCLAGCQSQDCPGYQLGELSAIKNQALVTFELQTNKSCEFKLCHFCLPQMMSGVEETEQC